MSNRLSDDQNRYRLRKELQKIIQNPTIYSLPKTGKFILLVDGVWYKFKGRDWVIYLMGLRPVDSDKAWILEPVLLPGKETGYKWKQVIESLPEELKSLVCAMVSDGIKGGKGIAKRHNWIIQRCQFHLIALLKSRHGNKQDVISRGIEKRIKEILNMRDMEQIKEALLGVHQLVDAKQGTPRIKGVAREFIRLYKDFFGFLIYPEYRLPRTNNCMESYAKKLRKKLYNISTPESLELWSKAFVMLNKRITCNGI
jgi:transposase-like protein